MMMDLDVERTCSLPDGRVLAYRDMGPADAPAVIFQPGFMACRLTGGPVDGARVISIDRPGIGRSSNVASRALTSAAADVAALADHLGLGHIALLGHSAGGPYAAACAAVLGDRVRALGIACGFAPMDRDGATDGINTRMAKGVTTLRRAPWMARLAAMSLPKQYAKDPDEAFHKQFGRDLPECDTRALEQDDVRRALLDAAVEATRQGAKPLAIEMKLTFARPWDFDLAAITAATRLWYGSDDTLTPPQIGRCLETRIPHATLTIFDGEGHMAAFTHWTEIVRSLMA
jgi:pimeloyl-ACP methyl ester carboxylesterase